MTAWLAIVAFAVAPDGYVGARVCAGCHAAQAAAQAKTGHARALAPAAQHPLTARMPDTFTAYRPEDYRLEWSKFKTRATSSTASREVAAEWAFGAGGQAVTFVGQLDEDRYVEHHLSYYAATGSFGATPGHRTLRPEDLASALGVLYRTFAPDSAIQRCFRCHSTGQLKLGAGLRIQPAELGVRCEACHGPGRAHALQRKAIFNPARLDAAGLNTLCGTCHRPPTESTDWSDPWNTRHQPVYLSQSACFLKGGASCKTCHDPHAPVVRDPAYYDAKCAACHKTTTAACKPSGCAQCHMPAVRPQRELTFANHWIGVYDPKSPLKPAR